MRKSENHCSMCLQLKLMKRIKRSWEHCVFVYLIDTWPDFGHCCSCQLRLCVEPVTQNDTHRCSSAHKTHISHITVGHDKKNGLRKLVNLKRLKLCTFTGEINY